MEVAHYAANQTEKGEGIVTPKQRYFATDEIRKVHADLVVRPDLHYGLDCTLLEYQRRMTKAAQMNNSTEARADFASRLIGATEAIELFLSLADLPESTFRTDSDNLYRT